MAAIADIRGWSSFVGLELLTRRGLLWHGMIWDDGREWPAWIVTDSTRRNAQGRRLDGKPWSGIEDAKAKTLPGCDPSWPIGAGDIDGRAFIVLCEGGPDFLAALLIAWWERDGVVDNIAPICVTGAGHRMHPDAMLHFIGKRTRIAVHGDAAGNEASKRWAAQLWNAGSAKVDGFEFGSLLRRDGKPIKDLADFATLLDPENPPAVRVFDNLAASHP